LTKVFLCPLQKIINVLIPPTGKTSEKNKKRYLFLNEQVLELTSLFVKIQNIIVKEEYLKSSDFQNQCSKGLLEKAIKFSSSTFPILQLKKKIKKFLVTTLSKFPS